MKQKLSDYVSNFLVENNITDIFTVTGGGAMHLNDSLGHNKKLNCITIYITNFLKLLNTK